MASSSTSSIQMSFKYDVFLSFRGEDTRKNFIDHLYDALTRKGINTYKDDESINQGKNISDELMKSIEDSKFYIIVFSENYASSSWCLEELVKIMECQKMDEHTAYPVFFDVEPTEIRNQTGSVKRVFAKHRNEKDEGKWRNALKEAADLAGWELKNTANGHEAKFIQKIVEKISLDIRCIDLSVDGKLVGMKARAKDIVSSLETGIADVRMIGIKGMGGAGKTTLARAVFDQISFQFEGSSFVENVREVSNDSSKGLTSLQKQILSDVLNESITVSGIFEGKRQMKKILCARKVLVVLDDVDNIEQLKALAGEPNWFKIGSRIIITTRDEQVLVAHRVNTISDVNLLSQEESICLFSRYAFGKEIPIQGYEELSEKVVDYAAGLPLTVTVLGSSLCGKSDDVWTDAIERLKRIPLKETLEKLELSYTSLEDDYKEIFLDVACILKGWEKFRAIRALKSCGFHAENGLKVLEQKSLITIYKSDEHDYLSMHDHIEEMGKNIVRHLHPNEPHRHSRLWIMKEIKDILASDSGTEAARCITSKLWNMELNLATIMKCLVNMKELRLLAVRTGYKDCVFNKREFDEVSQCLPNALQFLSWVRYPLTYLPKNFPVNNLVGLEMFISYIDQLWEPGERKVLIKLRFIDIRHSMLRNLDLTLVPNLETLILQNCYALVELDMHFGCQTLRFLNLRHSKLRVLNLGPTPNLEVLDLSYCVDLVQLHMHGEHLKLKSLHLIGTMLRRLDLGPTPNLELLELPNYSTLELHMRGESPKLKSLVVNLPGLRAPDLVGTPMLKSLTLYLHGHILRIGLDLVRTSPNLETLLVEGLDYSEELGSFLISICSLRCLRKLELAGSFPELPMDLHQLVCLEQLTLIHTKIKHLPNSICMLKHLKVLKLEACQFLEQLPGDLGRLENLKELTVSYAKIEHLPNSICMLKFLKILSVTHCKLLEQLPEDLWRLKSLEQLFVSCIKIKHLPNSICMLKHLKVLKLEACQFLEQLPGDLDRLENLEELTVLYAKIEHLPNSICMLKFLKILSVTHCKLLEQLPEDLGRLESLEQLFVSCIKIKHLPNSICMLKLLKILDLDYCELLEQLPDDLGRLESLERLSVSGTKIGHLPNSICMLKHLKVLNVEHCLLLEQLPEDLGRLECLEKLNLSECSSLTYLPNSICEMKYLKYLNLIDCILVEKLPEELRRLKGLRIVTEE